MQGVSKGTEKEEPHGTASDFYSRFKTKNYRVLLAANSAESNGALQAWNQQFYLVLLKSR